MAGNPDPSLCDVHDFFQIQNDVGRATLKPKPKRDWIKDNTKCGVLVINNGRINAFHQSAIEVFTKDNAFPQLNRLNINNHQFGDEDIPFELIHYVCNKKIRTLTLEYDLIQNIPQGFIKGCLALHQFNLNDNNINSLPDDLLKDTPVLHEIYLHNNQMTKLDYKDFFQSARNYLKIVNLSNNRLESINWRMFDNLELQTLHFNNNRLKQLPPKSLDALGKTLKTLDISNNQFEELDWAVFDNLKQLEQLKLDKRATPKGKLWIGHNEKQLKDCPEDYCKNGEIAVCPPLHVCKYGLDLGIPSNGNVDVKGAITGLMIAGVALACVKGFQMLWKLIKKNPNSLTTLTNDGITCGDSDIYAPFDINTTDTTTTTTTTSTTTTTTTLPTATNPETSTKIEAKPLQLKNPNDLKATESDDNSNDNNTTLGLTSITIIASIAAGFVLFGMFCFIYIIYKKRTSNNAKENSKNNNLGSLGLTVGEFLNNVSINDMNNNALIVLQTDEEYYQVKEQRNQLNKNTFTNGETSHVTLGYDNLTTTQTNSQLSNYEISNNVSNNNMNNNDNNNLIPLKMYTGHSDVQELTLNYDNSEMIQGVVNLDPLFKHEILNNTSIKYESQTEEYYLALEEGNNL